MTRTDGAVTALAAAMVGALYLLLWQPPAPPTDLSVWVAGEERMRLPLDRPRRVSVNGALGTSVIEIEPGRARVAASPGPRQICVRTGWLREAGESAICLPNQVVIRINGGSPRYDAMNF